MARVHIKWKSVVFASLLLFLIIVIGYRSMNTPFLCTDDSESYSSVELPELHNYCNYYSINVTGSEGDLSPVDNELLSVHVVIRHGDRSPLHSLPGVSSKSFQCRFSNAMVENSPQLVNYLSAMKKRGLRQEPLSFAGNDLFPDSTVCDMGSLTPEGAAQHIQLGNYLRSKYIDKHHLLQENTNQLQQQILVRCTKVLRTLQSAVAFMYGFQPKLDMSQLAHIQQADNNTMCTEQSGHQCSCEAVGLRHLDSFSSTFSQSVSVVRHLPSTERVAGRLGLAVHSLPRLSHIFDVALTHFCHATSPNCFGTSFARDIFDILRETGRRSVADSKYLSLSRLKSQPLLYEIAQRMSSISSSSSSQSEKRQRFVLYSGHDSTVEPLASALGISNGYWPRYASRLVFELYRRTKANDYVIRVLMNGSDMTKSLPFCSQQSYPCPLKNFLDFVSEARYNGSPGNSGYSNTCKSFVSP